MSYKLDWFLSHNNKGYSYSHNLLLLLVLGFWDVFMLIHITCFFIFSEMYITIYHIGKPPFNEPIFFCKQAMFTYYLLQKNTAICSSLEKCMKLYLKNIWNDWGIRCMHHQSYYLSSNIIPDCCCIQSVLLSRGGRGLAVPHLPFYVRDLSTLRFWYWSMGGFPEPVLHGYQRMTINQKVSVC